MKDLDELMVSANETQRSGRPGTTNSSPVTTSDNLAPVRRQKRAIARWQKASPGYLRPKDFESMLRSWNVVPADHPARLNPRFKGTSLYMCCGSDDVCLTLRSGDAIEVGTDPELPIFNGSIIFVLEDDYSGEPQVTPKIAFSHAGELMIELNKEFVLLRQVKIIAVAVCLVKAFSKSHTWSVSCPHGLPVFQSPDRTEHYNKVSELGDN